MPDVFPNSGERIYRLFHRVNRIGRPTANCGGGTSRSDSTLSALSNEESWTDSHRVSHAGTVYTVTATDPVQPVTAFQCKRPDGAGNSTVWGKISQEWKQQDTDLDGTYLVFQAEGDSVTFAVQETSEPAMAPVLVISVWIIVAGVLIVLLRKRGRKESDKILGCTQELPI